MTNQKEARFRPYAGVLAECRDMVRDRLVAALAEARQAIEAELFNRRLSSTDASEGQLFAEAQHQLRRIGSELDRGFRAAFEKAFHERTAAGAPEGVYRDAGLGFPELSLVDDEQFAEDLTVQNLARQLRTATDAELQELQPRVAFMLGEAEIDAARDPLAPDTICEALSEACGQLDSPRPVKALLLEMFARRLGAGLAPVYHDVNQHLVARQVLPRIRHSVARTPGRAPSAAGSAQPGGAGPAPAEVGNILQQLFGARDAAGGGGPGHAAAVATEGTSAEVLDLLTRLQRGESAGALGGETFAVAADPGGTTNVIHGLVDAGLSKHLNQVDGIVIDVVATMFDYIFDDDRVPGAIKGLIGRLQIPVLKLAMKDHAFFSNRQHPARRLINALAQAAITWDDTFSTESPLFRIADFLVHRVQDEFNDDGTIFAVCLQEFEDFLADQDRRVDKRAASVTSQLEQRERMEIATSVAQNTVAAHVANPAVPAPVREFIDGLWSKVLRRAAVVGGESGDQWRQAAGVMDELVWSVLPKRGREERQRMVQTLPRLLAGLREGLEAIDAAQVLRDSFFTELVKLHAAAVKAGMSDSGAVSGAVSDAAAPPAAPPPPAAETATAADAPELDDLARGSSIELTDESGVLRRVRLTWISPARTMYLFANRQGQRALALTRIELARRFAAGEARLADDEPLLDRIVGNVLDSYQPEARHT